MEVTNRFKGLDLTECLKNYGWRFGTLNRRQGSRPSPRKINARQSGCLRRALQIVEKREVKGKRRKGKIYPTNAEFLRIARREKKASLSEKCREIEENNRMGKTRDLFKKVGDT